MTGPAAGGRPKSEAGQTPFHGKCAECGHVWVVLHLPMDIIAAAEAMMRATCPECGCGKVLTAGGGRE